MEKENNEIISAREAAEILHISKAHFLQLLKKGSINIPFVRIGKYAKFRKKDVQAYFDNKFSNDYDKEGEGG